MLKMRNLGLLLMVVAILGLPAISLAKGKKSKTPTPTTFDLPATIAKVDNGTVSATLDLPTTAATTVTIDGNSKTLADLKAGQTLTVTFSGSTISAIVATTPTK